MPTEEEASDANQRNRAISSSAITRAMSDANAGESHSGISFWSSGEMPKNKGFLVQVLMLLYIEHTNKSAVRRTNKSNVATCN